MCKLSLTRARESHWYLSTIRKQRPQGLQSTDHRSDVFLHRSDVFLIQNTQNHDGAAIQAKLDELIRVTAASNSFIGIEHLTEDEVDEFRKKCQTAAKKAGDAAV